MTRLEDLEERIESLSQLVAALSDASTVDLTSELMDSAKVMAIYSFVQELAEREGVKTEDFLKHYEIRFRYWHDYFLQQAEDISPERAAALDPRTVEQAGVSGPYTSMFEPPLRDNT